MFASFPIRLYCLVLAALLSGCLYTSHHFNTGKLLDPGATRLMAGYGQQPFAVPGCVERFASVEGDRCVTWTGQQDPVTRRDIYDTSAVVMREGRMQTGSFGYRLGMRRDWGIFTGAELGWHLEGPTNPASAEFDLKLGLPAPQRWKMFHSLSGGWIIGMWADNSFFLEYAASRTLGKHAVFGNLRGTYMATQPEEVFEGAEDNFRFNQHRRYAWQGAAGFQVSLGDIPILPDYLIPMAAVTWPGLPSLQGSVRPFDSGLQWNFNLGFGWEFK